MNNIFVLDILLLVVNLAVYLKSGSSINLIVAFFASIMAAFAWTSDAHAQVSGQVVPPGCYTSFEDNSLCWEPNPGEEALFPYFESDPSYALDYLGPVVGTLSNRYIEQYDQLLRWKRLARERGRRLRQRQQRGAR